MNSKFHMSVGVAAAGVIIATQHDHVTAGSALAILGASTFASVFPDIDNCQSKIGRRFTCLRKWQGPAERHREHFTHKPYSGLPLFTALFGALLMAINQFQLPILLAFFIGYFLHLFFDSYTPGGISWFPGDRCLSAAPRQYELADEKRVTNQMEYLKKKHPEMNNRWTNTSYAPDLVQPARTKKYRSYK